MSGGEWIDARALSGVLFKASVQRGAVIAYLRNGLGRARSLKATYRQGARTPVAFPPDEDLPAWIWGAGHDDAHLDWSSGSYAARVYRPGGSVTVEVLGLRFERGILQTLGIEQHAAHLLPPAIGPEIDEARGLHLSPYMRLMLEVIRRQNITPSNQSTKESLKAEILALSERFGCQIDGQLSDKLAGAMATLVREPSSQRGRGSNS